MAVFKDTTITDNGRALIANALGNNKQITFTRMVTSSKVYSDTTDISKLISIDELKQTVNLSRVSQEGTKVRLNAIFTNASVTTAYKIETIGLYGKIDSGSEILYSVTRAAEADTMPATNGINLATVEIDLITEINNSNGATMIINPSTLATLSTLQDYIKHEEKINWMGTDGYGGLLQDSGIKKVGIAYYDKANKQMVVPTIENTLTYFEGSKFIPISDYQTAKKLENLFETHWINLSNNTPVGKVFETTIKAPTKPYKVFYSVYTGGSRLIDLNGAPQYKNSEIVVNLGVSSNGFLQYSIAKNTSVIDGRHICVMFVF